MRVCLTSARPRFVDLQVVDSSIVSEIASLLRIDGAALTNALTTRRIKAGSDWSALPDNQTRAHRLHYCVFHTFPSPMFPSVTSPVTADVACNVRDGLAKAMYQRVFAWMVMRVNANLASA